MDRGELLEAVLESLPDGVAVIGQDGVAVCWNRAAEAITGYAALEVVGKPLPEPLEVLVNTATDDAAWQIAGHRRRIELRHKLGQAVQTVGIRLVLRDGLGGRIGWAMLFHPAQSLDALPHGESDESTAVAVSQEEMGRWGTDEFLVIAHERTGEMLAAHARTLAGLARTADFRWWGDRVQLTVSVGACQADPGEGAALAEVLKRAQKAMEASIHAGGNTITQASGRKTCSQS
jgi:PAS domain S-box-containing protein